MGWKNCCIIGMIILVAFVVPCQAGMGSDIFYYFLNQSETVTSVDDIVYTKSEFTPTKNVQSSHHIKGWIDIIGFEGMVQVGNITYIDNSCQPKPIIIFAVWDDGITSKDYITNNNVDFIKITDKRIITLNNITTVEIDIHMKWHHSVRRKPPGKGIKKTYYHEYATFSASLAAPLSYPKIIVQAPHVKILNTSVSSKTIVHLPKADCLLGYRIEYKNESIEYFHSVLSVENQDNGLPFGNITPVTSQSIYEDSDVFSRAGDSIIINFTDVDDSLKIYAITPYDEYDTNYTVSNYSMVPVLDRIQLSSAFGMLMSGWMIVFLIRYYRR